MTKLHLALAFSLLLIITGCSEKTSEEYIALAETKIQQNDIPSAIIDLKNAISVNARDAKSRFMLGELYAQRGSSAAAEKELKRAVELGYEPNKVLPLLANVYSLQYKHAEIIELVENSRNLAPEVSTSLLLYKALAHFQLGEPYKAKKAVADANEISSDSLYSRLGNAYVDYSNNDIEVSLEKINEILKEQPDFADAHLLKGQLTSVTNDQAGAVESFEKYKELLPQTYQSRVLLANAYVKNKQYEEAEKEIDQLLKVNPDQPFVNQLKAAVRFQAQDFVKAKLHSESAIQNGSANVPNKIIAGVSAHRLGAFEQAYTYLSSIKNRLPADHPILKMLAILELKLGTSSESGLTLTSLDGLSEDDVILLSAASAQLMREGKTTELKAVLDQIDSIEFSDPLRIAQKGMLRLSLDDIDGLADLEQALALDPNQNTANTALARAYIDNGLFDKALDLSATWIEQKPEEVYGYILAAVSYVKLNKTVEAEKMYTQALTLDPNNIAANNYYADKAESAGDKQGAVAYLSKIIEAKPEHIASLRKYFVLQQDIGRTEEGIAPIESAFNQEPDKLQFRLLFAQALLTQKQYSRSISVLEKFTPTESSPDRFWIVLGNAYFLNEQSDEAIDVAESWISVQPKNKNAYLRLIALHDTLKNSDKALDVAKTAHQRFPADEQFIMFTTYFNIVTGDIKAAERSFSRLSDTAINSVVGQGLYGQILLEKGDPASALPKLKISYQQNASQSNATLVGKALRAQKQYSQAIAFLQKHQQEVKKSVASEVQIAELAILSGDLDFAVKQYEAVLALDPNNSRALNNLAYILIDRENFHKAYLYAKRAAELSPDYAPVLDTYGTTLFKIGKANEAMDVFEKAYNLDKNDTEVALRYVEAMIAVKHNSKAEKILNELKSDDPDIRAAIKRLKAAI